MADLALVSQPKRGFTLVELLVTILISSIVLSSIGLLLGTGLRGNRTASEISNVSQNTEVTSALLQIELRQAGYLGQLPNTPTQVLIDNYVALLNAAPWPFTTAVGSPPFPAVRQIAPGGTALLGPVCHAQSVGNGCLETFSVRAITSTGYQLEYVRYHARPDGGIPTLYRTGTTNINCSTAFVCPLAGGQTVSAIQGVEDLRFFQSADGVNWTAMAGNLPADARVGVYFRVRGLQPELTGTNSGTFTGGIDLPAGVTIPSVAVNDSFRRAERWLDLWLPNI